VHSKNVTTHITISNLRIHFQKSPILVLQFFMRTISLCLDTSDRIELVHNSFSPIKYPLISHLASRAELAFIKEQNYARNPPTFGAKVGSYKHTS